MRLNDIVKGLVLGTALYAAGCGGSDNRTGCQNDNDCRAPRICVSGSCRNPSSSCTPACSGKECGDDGCGDSCGSCSEGYACESGRCVESSQCNPASGCSDRGCVFYDDFSGSSLDRDCKWPDTSTSGDYHEGTDFAVSGGELHFYDITVIQGRMASSTCSRELIFETKVKIPDGALIFSLPLTTSTPQDGVGVAGGYWGRGIPCFRLVCNNNFVDTPEVNLTDWNTLRVSADGEQATLYVNGSAQATIPCPVNTITIDSFSLQANYFRHSPSENSVDYVKEICR